MQREQIISLQEELRLFVLKAQNKLASVRKSIQEIKESGRKNTEGNSETANLDGLPAFREYTVEVAEEAELKTTERTCQPQPTAATEKVIPTQLNRSEFPQTSNATDRLEAIKRRLAKQIENT